MAAKSDLVPDLRDHMVLTVTAASAISGGLAGACTDLVLFPLDTLKTRLQTRQPPKGAVRFYAGLASAMAGSFPSSAVFFTVYDSCQRAFLKSAPDRSHILTSMTSAAVANVFACGVRVPFEVIKQRMQAGMHSSSILCVKSIFQDHGIRGLFSGYASTVFREIPFDAVQFALWETFKRQYSKRVLNGDQASPSQSAIMGAIAGGMSAALTTPLDVVKTRLMTQNGKVQAYTGFRDCFVKTWKQEGIRGLTRGIYHRVAWISLGGFLFFGSYESVSQHLAYEWNMKD